jgi:hypothetical protein
MKLFASLLLIGVSTGALAAPAPTGTIIVLKCELAHSVPRTGGHSPPPPFIQHFRVNMSAKTVDGVHATVSSDKIGWEPRQTYLRPYATLALPDWQFHAVKWFGRVRDDLTGTCVEQH